MWVLYTYGTSTGRIHTIQSNLIIQCYVRWGLPYQFMTSNMSRMIKHVCVFISWKDARQIEETTTRIQWKHHWNRNVVMLLKFCSLTAASDENFIKMTIFWFRCLEWACATTDNSNNEVNSLWPSDAIWWHRTESTLAKVMAWCLMAPSHYLRQCWLFIKWEGLWHSLEHNFTGSIQVTILYDELQIYTFKIIATPLREKYVKLLLH